MADQNITAGIRGVQELTDARNEITRLRATISQERTKAAAAEARAAASEALQRSREAPAGIPIFGGPGAASKWDPTGAAYRAAQAQATQAKNPSEFNNSVVGKVTDAIDSITPMKVGFLGATAAIAGFTIAVSQATAAENARRARSMSANEAVGMVGALPKDVEAVISQGQAGKGGSISPDDAQRITALYGTSLSSLGPAASAISPAARAARLRELFKLRRGGMSMSALSSTISANGSPFMDVGTGAMIAGVPGQTSNLGITEAQDASAQSARGAAAEGQRSTFRDAAFRASQDVELASKSGNFLADLPGAQTAVTAWNLYRPYQGFGAVSLLERLVSNTSPATKVPSPIEGRQ